jgi:DNA-binding NtrC family response regulator
MSSPTRILLVDDEPAILGSLGRLLRRRGFDVALAAHGQAALHHLETQACEVVISDFKMPGMSGAELLAVVAAGYPRVRRILLSGYADLTIDIDAVILSKPFDEAQLLRACEASSLR